VYIETGEWILKGWMVLDMRTDMIVCGPSLLARRFMGTWGLRNHLHQPDGMAWGALSPVTTAGGQFGSGCEKHHVGRPDVAPPPVRVFKSREVHLHAM
jgi:hypothetical protein